MFPECPPTNTGTNMGAFTFRNARIYVRSIRVEDGPCSGKFCDQQGLVNAQGEVSNQCVCFQLSSRFHTAVFILDIDVILPNQDPIHINNYVSRRFMETFCFLSPFPNGARHTVFNHRAVIDCLLNKVRNSIDYINDRGGFLLKGWYKRGEIIDQGVEVPMDNRVAREKVEASVLNLHICRVDVMQPMRINLAHLRSLMFDPQSDLTPPPEESDSESDDEMDVEVPEDDVED